MPPRGILLEYITHDKYDRLRHVRYSTGDVMNDKVPWWLAADQTQTNTELTLQSILCWESSMEGHNVREHFTGGKGFVVWYVLGKIQTSKDPGVKTSVCGECSSIITTESRVHPGACLLSIFFPVIQPSRCNYPTNSPARLVKMISHNNPCKLATLEDKEWLIMYFPLTGKTSTSTWQLYV